MRALVFRGPWDIGVEERPDPEPGAGEVLLEVVATGICGSDVHGYTGENGRRSPGQVMGHETVGRVVRAGPGADVAEGAVATLAPVIGCGSCASCAGGQDHRCGSKQVIGVTPTISAAFAERVVVPATNLVPLPDGMPIEYGALVEPLAVGAHAVARGGTTATDTVVVVGGGPIGQACVLAARRVGVTALVVSEPSADRRRLLDAIGVRSVDPTTLPVADAVTETLGRPATLVLDAVGSTRSVADALAVSELGGRVVLVGMHEPQMSIQAYALSTQERSIIGSFCYSAAEFRETAAWVGTAPPELASLVEGRVGMPEAPEAFRSLAAGENPASKILVTP